MMFQHVFAEMNEMLDEISRKYPVAQGDQKQDLIHKWRLLKHMSDGIIEEWLCFEEKMGVLRQNIGNIDIQDMPVLPEMDSVPFVKGQGYYKLLMFSEALPQFQQLLEQFPESMVGRTYLAMCYMHLEQSDEATKHFKQVLRAATNKRMRSVIYNALGCIEAQKGTFTKAKEYFTLAYHSDPSLPEPLANLEACLKSKGKLSYSNELTSLL